MNKRFMFFLISIQFFNILGAAPRKQYYGQHRFGIKQDQFVNDTFFHDKKNGVFVDIGAHAGTHFSNTYFFEKYLDWTGICIEPSPIRYKQLIKNRSCICFNKAIANENTIMQFADMPGGYLSGLMDKFEETVKKRRRIEQSIRENKTALIDVECVKLNDLLDQYHITKIDFLSIDTEGGELEILQSIDYERFDIDVMCVEVRASSSIDPTDFLESKNYTFVKRLGRDVIYKKRS